MMMSSIVDLVSQIEENVRIIEQLTEQERKFVSMGLLPVSEYKRIKAHFYSERNESLKTELRYLEMKYKLDPSKVS